MMKGMKMNKDITATVTLLLYFSGVRKDAGWQWYNEKINEGKRK